jgi:hypothetical protein
MANPELEFFPNIPWAPVEGAPRDHYQKDVCHEDAEG